MSGTNCLICSLPLSAEGRLYHPHCAFLLFGRKTAPILDLSLGDIRKAAIQVVQARITIPGVQQKLSLHLSQNRRDNRFTLIGFQGDFILKPPVADFPLMPEIEHTTMALAEIFGLKVVPHGLILLSSGEMAYITRRIDRPVNGEKLHMEDMCQLSGRLTEDKYRGSIEQIGKLIDEHTSNPLFDKLQLFDLVLFSYISGNADMHLKNFSLIYPLDNMIRLAPAYDLLATRLLLPENDDPEESALAINGKRRKLTHEDFKTLANNLGMSKRQLENSFNRFQKNLSPALDFLNRSLLPAETKLEYANLIQARVAHIGL